MENIILDQPMKQFIILITIFCLALNTNATTQAGDLIKYNGHQYTLYSLPLQQHPNFKVLNEKVMSRVSQHVNTACIYQAEWEVVDNIIYLVGIRSCGSASKMIHLNLSELFGSSFKNGKVKADWVNDKLYIQQGKVLHYDGGFGSIFQWEVELTVVNGKVTNAEQLDNNGTRISKFTSQPKFAYNFVHERIRWNDIPDLGDKKIRVNISIRTTGTPKPEISLLWVKNDLYSKEALRVAKLIPEWDVYYKRGIPLIKAFNIAVIFSEENRKKYSNATSR